MPQIEVAQRHLVGHFAFALRQERELGDITRRCAWRERQAVSRDMITDLVALRARFARTPRAILKNRRAFLKLVLHRLFTGLAVEHRIQVAHHQRRVVALRPRLRVID
eukprot:5060470-Prymnesium_polylepis.3